MASTLLFDALASGGIRTGEYAGAHSVAVFGDVAREFAALQSGCGVFDLGWRVKIFATGEDRMRWLNGMVTNNIKDLPPHRGCYNFLLNAQGKIQADLYVYNREDTFIADTDRAQAEKLLDLFDKFIIMDDVKIADASAKLTAIGMLGPKSEEVFAHLGLSVDGIEPLEMRDTTLQGMAITVVRGDWANVPSYEIWCAPENVAKVWQLATREGASQAGYEAYEMARIAAGRPRYGVDINDRDLPQETNQTRALHFQKGCYVGQEIVERIHSRGQVHRRFMAFSLDQLTPVGSVIERDGKPVGELTSVTTLPDGSVVGLGYIRRASENAEDKYLAGGVAVRPATLPIAS